MTLARLNRLQLYPLLHTTLIKKHNGYSRDGQLFEKILAEIYSGNGFDTNITAGTNDGGVDIIAEKDGMRIAIQAKNYNDNMTKKNIRKSDIKQVFHKIKHIGESKYGVKRIIKGFLDLLTVHLVTGYGNRPQHLLGSLGLGCFAISGLTMAILTFWWVVHRVMDVADPIDLHRRALFYFSIAGVIIGIQLLTSGFLAELITKKTVRDEQIYSIKDSVGDQDNGDV